MTESIIRTFCLAVIVTGLIGSHLFAQSTPPCATQIATCDDIPPNLLSVSYPSTTVNVQSENQTGTFMIMATALDPLSGIELVPPMPNTGVASGVQYAYISFQSAPCSSNSAPTYYAYAYLYPPSGTYYPPPGTFIAGQTQTLTGAIVFDTPYPPGGTYTYYTCSASIYDNVGNRQDYSLYGNQASTLLQGLPSIPVTVSPGDHTLPVLNALTISPGSADVTNGPKTFTATLNLTTGTSGVNIYGYANNPGSSYGFVSQKCN